MQLRLLSEKLLVIILLLMGLFFLQVIVAYTLPLIVPTHNMDVFMAVTSNSHWIGKIIFGLVILWLTRSKGLIALPIGILSVILPTYGPIFYVLTTLQNKSEND